MRLDRTPKVYNDLHCEKNVTLQVEEAFLSLTRAVASEYLGANIVRSEDLGHGPRFEGLPRKRIYSNR